MITGADGAVVATGRNRIYHDTGGDDPIAGSLIAHAEMNAMAKVPQDVALEDATLWTTLEPCAMCAASCAMAHVGAVRFLGWDPLFDGMRAETPKTNDWIARRWPIYRAEPLSTWTVLAMVLAFHGIAARNADGRTMKAHRAGAPEITGLTEDLVAKRTLAAFRDEGLTVEGVHDRLASRLSASVQAVIPPREFATS